MVDDNILSYAKKYQVSFLNMIQKFVELESPTHEDKKTSDKCADFLEQTFGEIGFQFERIKQEACGDHLYGEIGKGQKGTLIVGHYDTVYPIGTLETMPFKVEEKKAYGPGILDMKSGIVMTYFAIKILKELGMMPKKRTGVFFNSDEESGSFNSKEYILKKAEQFENVLVVEPGINDINSVKTGRFGRGTYTITAYGRAAHSGSNPHLAINPLLELAHQLIKFDGYNDKFDGVTFTPTMIKGGILGTCMVPESAYFSMDVRYESNEKANIMHKQIMKQNTLIPGVRLEIDGKIDKPAMLADTNLYHKAVDLGKLYGLEIKGVTVGGGSDGNFTSSAGIPTLDGLGATGEFLHNPLEYIHIDHVPYRTALLANLIQVL